MPATPQVLAAADIDEPAVLARVDAQWEDEYWRRAFWCERYFRSGLDYEDYAPAYCVGYIGYAQYGGEYEDAEGSLCANWERIRGDSRLTFADARSAMRAAWNRMVEREEPIARRQQQRGPHPAASAMRAAPG
ncbi:MAG: hypothetical protein JWP43_922 [Ramlibacter sp.]|jgi:hypothetical protein|nr:hypothetical protein [Ramlibacter sp.]